MRLSNYKKIRKLHCAIKQYTKVKVRMTSCLLMPREVTPIQSSGGGGALLSAIEFIRISHIIIVLILITETTACV